MIDLHLYSRDQLAEAVGYRGLMDIRSAVPDNADEMSNVLDDISSRATKSAKRSSVRVAKIHRPPKSHPMLGWSGHVRPNQSLKWAWIGNPDDVQEGWGIIGTHISPRAARRGVGAALFKESLLAARTAALNSIDATIGEDNQPALAYYRAIGFKNLSKGTWGVSVNASWLAEFRSLRLLE